MNFIKKIFKYKKAHIEEIKEDCYEHAEEIKEDYEPTSAEEHVEKLFKKSSNGKYYKTSLKYVNKRTSKDAYEMMKNIEQKVIELRKIVNNYTKTNYKEVTVKRTLFVGDILVSKLKDMNVVANIIDMSYDIEKSEYDAFYSKYKNIFSIYCDMWVHCHEFLETYGLKPVNIDELCDLFYS